MNFTKRIKEELTGETFQSSCCKAACLSAFLRTSGSILTRGGLIGFSFFTENEKVAGFFNKIIKDLYGIDGVYSGKNSGGKDKITCEYVGENTFGALIELGILVAGENGVGVEMGVDIRLRRVFRRRQLHYPERKSRQKHGLSPRIRFFVLRNRACFFRTSGRVRYYREAYREKEKFCRIRKEQRGNSGDFNAYRCGEMFARSCRNGHHKRLQQQREQKEQLGNINKQIEAAERQIAAINAIKETIGLEALKKELFDVCELRLSDEFLTLEEMSEKLGVSKSCVNHRMRKIIEIANSVS